MRLLPEFQRVQDTYARLHAQYSAGALSPEQFTSAVEAEMVQHDAAYWVIDANSGRWLTHNGQEWREAQPPMESQPSPPPVAGPRTTPPAAPPLTNTAATIAAPAPAAVKRSNLLVPVLAVAVVAIGAAFYLGQSSRGGSEASTSVQSGGGSTGDTGASRGGAAGDSDPLVSLILRNAVPSAFDRWNPKFEGPDIMKNSEPAPGETGRVLLTVYAQGDRSSGLDFIFTVFRTPAEAERDYTESTTFDTSRWSASEREQILGGVFQPEGMRAQCLGDSARTAVSSCRTITGRAVVFVKFPIRMPREDALAASKAMVNHVTELQRRPG